jgi:hypothetical protein
MTLQALWQAWHAFWFEPKSPTPVAIFRILFGLLIMQTALVQSWPGWLIWYGNHAVVPLPAVKQYFWHLEPRFDLLLALPPDDRWVIAFFWIFVLAAFFVAIGFLTRYSMIFIAISLVSMHHHQPFNINGGDSYLRLMSIFLAFSYAGEAFSVDNLIKRWQGKEVGNKQYCPWAQRMLQIQMALVYWNSFWCKVSGTQWLDGTAVYYATRLDDLMRFPLPYLVDNLWFCKCLTWYTLVVEFGMWTLVWFKELRYIFLAGALILHLGIDTVINLPVFEWAFVAGLVNFLEPEDISHYQKVIAEWWRKRTLFVSTKLPPLKKSLRNS